MNKYFYIYNPNQADYFLKSGLQVIEIGKGAKGDIYIKFIRNEKSEEIFTQWCKGKLN
ncbi:hypothetical protein [Bacillus xiapuensis]|uniref:Uncharacterized protein n=1 Tax=Bacillus xiapuensis TaxID=2014075 RepID=A0ABU6NAA9_9BACI|nr:hypothetical protein [Bacillus xiapuensis]